MLRRGLVSVAMMLGLVLVGGSAPAGGAAEKVGGISVTVVGPDGAVMPELEVWLQKSNRVFMGPKSVGGMGEGAAQGAKRWAQTMETVAKVATDKDGKVQFKDVPVGSYRVAAIKAGVGKGGKVVVVEEGKMTEVKLELKAPPKK